MAEVAPRDGGETLWTGGKMSFGAGNCGYPKIFPRLTTPTAVFDVEMLVIAAKEGFRIAECPVRWRHDFEAWVPMTAKNIPQIFIELLRIRRAQGVLWPLKAKVV